MPVGEGWKARYGGLEDSEATRSWQATTSSVKKKAARTSRPKVDAIVTVVYSGVEALSVCIGLPTQIDLCGIGHGQHGRSQHDGILHHQQSRKGKEGESVHTGA